MRLVFLLSACLLFCACRTPLPPAMGRFVGLRDAEWREAFHDPCTSDWRERWALDGRKATLSNGPEGMDFRAGPTPKDQASHAVLWTKDSFAGDIKVEYEYTRLDDAVRFVNIIYLQATGMGEPPYVEDISKWADLRTTPAMKMYYNHMNVYHISYAGYSPRSQNVDDDHIRARRYMPDRAEGLKGTIIPDDNLRTGLFRPGVPHKITIVKRDREIFMHVRNAEQEMLCHWNNQALPPVTEGRIGLRHMWTRAARYRDFRVSVPGK